MSDHCRRNELPYYYSIINKKNEVDKTKDCSEVCIETTNPDIYFKKKKTKKNPHQLIDSKCS